MQKIIIYMAIYRKCHIAFNHSIVNVQQMCPTKVNFDWANSEIGWKMANGQLLFCTLYTVQY